MSPLNKASNRSERGSALIEAALIFPVLILLVYWSSAMTDVMVLRIKAQEATRFALWEMTVFRDPGDVANDVQTRFRDLKSAQGVNVADTGLLMYPRAANILWSTNINPNAATVPLSGSIGLPTNLGSSFGGIILGAINTVLNFLSSSVDSVTRFEQFNTGGSATASVTLTRASHVGSIILNGGDLAGHNSGGQDLGAPNNMVDFSFQTPLPLERPMRLVYDSWKAWPKPAAFTTLHGNVPGAVTDPTVSPMKSYPVVESMVSKQVEKIAFFGLTSLSWFEAINNAIGKVLNLGVSQAVFGGQLPTIFATAPMDHSVGNVNGGRDASPGPITILPADKPDVSWVPGNGMAIQRLGDQTSTGTGVFTVDDVNGMSAGDDRSRYTVPYRINTPYWRTDGGTNYSTFGAQVTAAPSALTTNNKYVTAFGCRGHYFAGSYKAQISTASQRFRPTCTF